MTLPLLLTALDRYPLKRSAWGEKWPFYALTFPVALSVLYSQRYIGATVSMARLGLLQRLGLFFYTPAFYLYKTVWPFHLSPLYPIGSTIHVHEAAYSLSVAVVLAITVGLYSWRKHWPAGLAVWSYSLLCLFPVSGLFQSGPQIAADRYSYLPSLGIAVLMGCAWKKWGKSAWVGSITTFLLAGFMVLTWKQCLVWHDSTTLWSSVLDRYPNSVLALTNLGNERQYAGRLEDAIVLYHRALDVNPAYAIAQSNWGAALHKEGKWQEAVPHFEEALRLNPRDSLAHESMGIILAGQGKLEQAATHLQQALDVNPNLISAQHNLTVIQRHLAGDHY